MLEEQDFKKIREEIGEALETVVLPVLNEMKTEMGEMKAEIGGMKTEMGEMKAEMVTKSYLDDKFADLEGSVIVRQRKEDKKINLLIEFLQKKKILEEDEIKMLKDFQIFSDLSLNN